MPPTIAEPVTMLTDYLLAIACVFFAASLVRRARAKGGRSLGLWVGAFLVTAFAALAGGSAHGFRPVLGEELWTMLWSVTLWSIGLGSVLLIGAGVRSVLRSESSDEASRKLGIRNVKWAIAVSLVALAVLVGRLSLHEHFNKNDLYHAIQLLGLYLLYRGALLLHGLEAHSPRAKGS